MKKCRVTLRAGLLAAALVASATVAVLAEDFNEARLHAGEAEYRAKRYLEAIDEFRIAAFGYLDQPGILSECLVRLSLAQSAAGKAADADATLARFVEVERRFSVYGRANLEPDLRSDFRNLLTHRVPEATLVAIPSLSTLVETEEQKIARFPPADRRRALEAAALKEPMNARWDVALARLSLDQGEPKEAETWATKALVLDPTSGDALAYRAQARVARGDFADASKDLSALSEAEYAKRPNLYADKFVCLVAVRNWAAAEQVVNLIPASASTRIDVVRAQRDLAEQRRRASAAAGSSATSAEKKPAGSSSPGAPTPTPSAGASKQALAESRTLVSTGKAAEAEQILTSALRGDPQNRDLRLALLEAACLAGAYDKALAQLPAVVPFTDGEAPSMFYAAVALFETGKADEARGYMKRAAPRVSGPMVDEYSKKILETP